ncbi:hypothetical protein V8C35DRAFT_189023 [Trichoderma chlorosporum]
MLREILTQYLSTIGGEQTVISPIHDRAHPPTCLGAYTHTRIHTYMLVPHIQTTIHASCMLVQKLYPPRANANNVALVPYSFPAVVTPIEDPPYPGLAERLLATSTTGSVDLIVINDSRIDTQSPMAVRQQTADQQEGEGEREREKAQQSRARQHFLRKPTRTRSRYLAASTAREELVSARLVSRPISWRQLNNTYIRARLHTHTSCTCARTCSRTTYSYIHAHSGIKKRIPQLGQSW